MGAIDAAEEFLTGTGDGKLAEEEAVELAGQHVIAVADVMGGEIRAELHNLQDSSGLSVVLIE